VLLLELALLALILILPQVDLPDFTFHGGTAPVAVKARSTSAPSRSATPAVTQAWSPLLAWHTGFEAATETIRPSSHTQLSLLCTLIC